MKKITKISTVDFPIKESAESIEEYGASVWNSLFSKNDEDHKSPPIDYWIAGSIIGEVECGKPLMVQRSIRNGVVVDGIFISSPIQYVLKSMDELCYITTKNSIYKIEDYEPVS